MSLRPWLGLKCEFQTCLGNTCFNSVTCGYNYNQIFLLASFASNTLFSCNVTGLCFQKFTSDIQD